MGDPLARPYAHFAEVDLASLNPHIPWSGVVTLQPKVVPAPDRSIAQLELWVDGQLFAYAQADKVFTWDTQSMDDGFHDLRLVAQEDGPIETRSYARFGVMLANSDHHLVLDPLPQQVRHGKRITVSGSATAGREAALWQGNRKLASAPVNGGRWRLQVASQMLGVGPVSLGVHVTFDDNTVVRSAPLEIKIVPPELAGKAPGTDQHDAGKIETTANEGDLKEVKPIKLDGRLRNLKDVQHLTMAGQFTVARSGFYELVVSGEGKISVIVDNHTRLSDQDIDMKQTRFFPLALEQGPHDLQIEFSPADNRPYLKLILEGDQVATIPEVRVVKDIRKKENAAP